MSVIAIGVRRGWMVACCALLAAAVPAHAAAQMSDRDFVVTMGASAESYSGNFSAVTLTVVDSTTRAAAAIGQIGTRGHRLFFLGESGSKTLRLGFDGGMRQFAAMGFHLRDYAPREWVSQLDVGYGQEFGVGDLMVNATYRGHAVEDRPPMPLFLQPGYQMFRGVGRFLFVPVGGLSLDALVDLENADYEAPAQLAHLDLLDRESRGFEVGLRTGADRDWSIRLFSGLRWSHYERQQFGDDPFRRDRATNLGATWSINRMQRETGQLSGSVSVEGTMNRSNSRRPEYNALSVTSNLFTPLPWWGLNASGRALLTWKTYIVETPFARLVPGEEADNASVIDVTLTREMANNLNAQLRFGWTRAETDIGSSYYNRFGTTLLFNFRPGG